MSAAMPRTPRHNQKALCYHLFNRGLNHQSIFCDDRDRSVFLDLIARYKQEAHAKVYHWTLMDNHFHLLAEIRFMALRTFMGGIQQCYARHHHSRHKTAGTFWQGRFHSKPVETRGEYIVRCGRYIERNPVRAGLIDQAHHYPWSSAAFYVFGRDDGVTDPNVYIAGDSMGMRDRDQYRRALLSVNEDAWVREHDTPYGLGSLTFTRNLKRRGGRYWPRRGRPVK